MSLGETKVVTLPTSASDHDLQRLYFDDLSKRRGRRLLTRVEEVSFAKLIEGGRKAEKSLWQADLGKRPLDESAMTEFERAVVQGREARGEMIEASLGLVVSMANRRRNQNGVSFLDLINEGNVGLMIALDKFDWRRGHKFSTYATWWIRKFINRVIANQGCGVSIQVDMFENARKIGRYISWYETNTGYQPDVETIAGALKLKPSRVALALKHAVTVFSLNNPVGEYDDAELQEIAFADKTADPEQEAIQQLLRGDLEKIFEALTAREERILMLRYGIFDGYCWSLVEIGKRWGLSKQRISQIENEAFAKLRASARKELLAGYLDR